MVKIIGPRVSLGRMPPTIYELNLLHDLGGKLFNFSGSQFPHLSNGWL